MTKFQNSMWTTPHQCATVHVPRLRTPDAHTSAQCAGAQVKGMGFMMPLSPRFVSDLTAKGQGRVKG